MKKIKVNDIGGSNFILGKKIDKIVVNDEKQVILEREKVDMSTLKTLKTRTHAWDLLPKDRYFIYKTGGINPHMKELGPIFPVIKNFKGKILKQSNSNSSSLNLVTKVSFSFSVFEYNIVTSRFNRWFFCTATNVFFSFLQNKYRYFILSYLCCYFITIIKKVVNITTNNNPLRIFIFQFFNSI